MIFLCARALRAGQCIPTPPVVQSTTGGGVEIARNRTYSPLSSRAKRGDPVNKKALRAFRPQTYCTGLPQSYANVFNVDRTPSQ